MALPPDIEDIPDFVETPPRPRYILVLNSDDNDHIDDDNHLTSDAQVVDVMDMTSTDRLVYLIAGDLTDKRLFEFYTYIPL